ncbi:hypothetical protein P5W98_00735 [Paraburkholderia sp. A1BS-2L]|uniref:hypothetical protein n=1 Tax=Paraburkholderia sp. A1BS-2L TaxID=3028373 RepID=UPI003DA84282
MAKHFGLSFTSFTDEGLMRARKGGQIRQEAALDGLERARISVPAQHLPAETAVSAYKGLAVVERAFRSL